jgi:hypothetical protein
MSTEILREQLYHLPTYLIDDRGSRPTGEISLFVRRLRLVQTPKATKIKAASDVWFFPDEDAMVAAIERYGLMELPAAADGDLTYVPGDFIVPGVRVEGEYGARIVAPEAVGA